jgi:hypothetical protein
MLRAAMPEAPIKKDRDLSPSEGDICCTTDPRHWTQPHTVTQPQGVHGRAERELWSRVTALIAAHHIANGGGGRPGVRVLGAHHGSLFCRGFRSNGGRTKGVGDRFGHELG